MKKIFGLRSVDILKRMQRAVLSGSLNIAHTYVQSHHKVNS